MDILHTGRSTLMDLLPSSVAAKLHKAGTQTHYGAGQLIQSRGDAHRGLSIVVSGRIVAGTLGLDGSFVVTSMLQRGECFGEFTLFADLPRTHDLTAATEATLLQITEQAFAPIYDAEPAISRALLSITLRRTHELLEFLDGQRRLTLPVRLGRVLLSFHDASLGDDKVVCRQEELAYLLGVTRVSVGKALKTLVAQGFIRTGYGAIAITDASGLAAWARAHSQITPVAAPRMTLAAE